MDVLVFSPTPTFPADQGNRQRVRALCEALQRRGSTIHFAYFPREWGGRFSVEGHREMTRQWDFFDTVIPSKPFVYLAENGQFGIDDWWDEAIGRFVRYKTQGQRFDACIVNYAFFSKVFDHLPPDVTRILDTHDRLSGRREMLERNGVAPEFFYTGAAEEKIALDRADLVIAINAEEARFFRSLSDTPVITLGHVADSPPVLVTSPVPAAHPGPAGRVVRMGFLGSPNSVNVKNVSDFLARLAREPALPGVEIHLYGACCDSITLPAACATPIRSFGRVAELGSFYANVDCVFVPFLFGTGQKIKLIEALACGLPLIATANASEGSGSTAPAHLLGSFDEVIGAMRRFATDPDWRETLRSDTRSVLARYRHTVETTLDAICDIAEGTTLGLEIDPTALAAACRGWSRAQILDTGCRLIAVLDMLCWRNPLVGKERALAAIRQGLAVALGSPLPPVGAAIGEAPFSVLLEIVGLTLPRRDSHASLRLHLPGLAPASAPAPTPAPASGDPQHFDLSVDILPPGRAGSRTAQMAIRTPGAAHPAVPVLRCTRLVVLAADLDAPAVTAALHEIFAGLRLRLGHAVTLLGIDAEGRQAGWQGQGFAGPAPGFDVPEILTRSRGAVLAEPSAVLAIGFSQQSAGALHRMLINDAGPLVSLPGKRALAVDGEVLAQSPAEAALWLAHLFTTPADAAQRTARRRAGVAALEQAPLISARLRLWLDTVRAARRSLRLAEALALETGPAAETAALQEACA